MEKHLLDIRLQMEGLICEREGMIAENMQRQVLGQSMAYTMDNFECVNTQIQQLIQVLRGY